MTAFTDALDEFETALYLDRRHENRSDAKAVESAKRVNNAVDALEALFAKQREEIIYLSSQESRLKAEYTRYTGDIWVDPKY